MVSQRQARRERNREDFLRATQASVAEHPSHMKSLNKMGTPLSDVGTNAGNTYREHLEDEIRKAVRVFRRHEKEAHDLANEPGHAQNPQSWTEQGIEHKRKAARGIIRGLCKALLIYEDSYDKDNRNRLIQMEKEFLNEGNE